MGEPLRTRLEKLREELERAEPGDADARARVADVQRDVREIIDQPATPAFERQQSLLERLRNAIPFFESTHPTLTLAMSEVADELTRMGL